MDIYKAGGILIKDRKVLVERSRGKITFMTPGGKVEPGETSTQALIRELMEEFQIKVVESDIEKFGTFSAPASGQEHRRIIMDVFLLRRWEGEPRADNEVDEVRWINSQTVIEVGSIFEHEILPRLKAQNLIN